MNHLTISSTPNAQVTSAKWLRYSARSALAIALGCATLGLAGCASIMSGTSQNVKITSLPDAATVKVERLMPTMNTVEFEGKTPTQVKLHRKGSFLVTVSLNGYQKAEIPVSGGGVNGWVFGNILFGGLVGVIIDASDGAASMLKPDEINVKLIAAQNSQSALSTNVYALVYTGAPGGKTQIHAFPLKPMETAN